MTLHRSCANTADLLGVRNDMLRSTQEENIRDALFTGALELVDRI
jgi:hypothetical protein